LVKAISRDILGITHTQLRGSVSVSVQSVNPTTVKPV